MQLYDRCRVALFSCCAGHHCLDACCCRGYNCGCPRLRQSSGLQNYEGVKGPIRKAVTEVSREAYEQFLRGDTKAIPAWMQILDTDGPKAREKKARAIKAFKKKLRCLALMHQLSQRWWWCDTRSSRTYVNQIRQWHVGIYTDGRLSMPLVAGRQTIGSRHSMAASQGGPLPESMSIVLLNSPVGSHGCHNCIWLPVFQMRCLSCSVSCSTFIPAADL